MPFFSDQAVARDKKKRQRKNNMMLFLGAGSFAAIGLITISKNIVNGLNQDVASIKEQQQLQATQQLRQKEKGAMIVLEREPNNLTALQSLAEARLDLEKYQEALEPIDQLLTIFPENEDFLAMRSQAEQNLNKTTETPPTPEN